MKRIFRETLNSAIDLSIAPNVAFQFEQLRIHLDSVGGVGSGDLTISLDANAGSRYDTLLATQDMAALQDYIYTPTRPHSFVMGDVIKVAWLNANANTYGLEVILS